MAVYLFSGRKAAVTYSQDRGHRLVRLTDGKTAWVGPNIADEILSIGQSRNPEKRRQLIDRRLQEYLA